MSPSGTTLCLPYKIINLILQYSSLDMYFTYAQVSAPIRRLVYKRLTPIPYSSILHWNPPHRNLVIHLLHNQKPVVSVDAEKLSPQQDEIFAPEFTLDKWFDGVKYVKMVGESLKDWSNRTKQDPLPNGKSGDEGIDLVRALAFYHRNPSNFTTFMMVDCYLGGDLV